MADDFLKKIIFSDLKLKNRNSRIIYGKPLHTHRDSVWWGGVVWALPPARKFLEGGNAVKVNGNHYHNTKGCFCDFTMRCGCGKHLFSAYLLHHARNWFIAQKSCDLTPCNYFLWRFFKSRVNIKELNPELKAEIRSVTDEIESKLC